MFLLFTVKIILLNLMNDMARLYNERSDLSRIASLPLTQMLKIMLFKSYSASITRFLEYVWPFFNIIVGREFLTHLLYKDSSPLSFFKFCLPHSTNTHQIPFPALFVALFNWLNGWSLHIRCVNLLYDIMDLHVPSLGSFVPWGHCGVFYATRRQFTEV